MKINRALSIVLAALMVVAMLPAYAFASAAGTVTISGNSSFVSAPSGTYSKQTYTAVYNDVTDPKAFSWEVTKDGVLATDVWCVDGEFIVAGGANGTYNIVATHKATGAKSAEFPVTVTASVLYDYDNNIPPDNNITTDKLTTEADGNKYYNTVTVIDYSLAGSGVAEFKTFSFKFKVPTGTGFGNWNQYDLVLDRSSYKGPIIATDYSLDGVPTGKYTLAVKGSGSFFPLCDAKGNYKPLDFDTWYELSVVFEIPVSGNPKVAALYLEDEYYKTRTIGGAINESGVDLAGTGASRWNFYSSCDDIVMYSGAPYSGVILSSECAVGDEAFDIYTDELADGQTLSFTVSAKQLQETCETYMVVAAEYTADGKELLSADAKDLTTV
ncbi:MAG: hypothetical protein IKV89_00040, partial [Clostridia bacterium]|nr:hypothetical protein [Clostridia bacterium]